MSKEVSASLDDVVLQLKINNRLLAAQLKSSETVSHHDLVILIASTGASNKDVAELLDTTPQAVSMMLSRERSKGVKTADVTTE